MKIEGAYLEGHKGLSNWDVFTHHSGNIYIDFCNQLYIVFLCIITREILYLLVKLFGQQKSEMAVMEMLQMIIITDTW